MRRSHRTGGRTTAVQVDVGAHEVTIAYGSGRAREQSRLPRPRDLRFPPALRDAIEALLADGGGTLQATLQHPSTLRPLALQGEVGDPGRGLLRVRRDGRRAEPLAWPREKARLEPPLRLLGLELQRERCASPCAHVDDATFDSLDALLVRSPYRLPMRRIRASGRWRAPRATRYVEQRMHRLTAAVRAHRDGATGFAGYLKASDAALERGGDCTEFALVLAAVGRAQGIPTRIVSGLAYASRFTAQRDVFSPHMWVQACTGTGWQSFDAALERFGAGHIALAVGTGDPVAHAQAM